MDDVQYKMMQVTSFSVDYGFSLHKINLKVCTYTYTYLSLHAPY